MKTGKVTLAVLLLIAGITAFSQVSIIPQGFSYQAIARDTLGSPKANQNVIMRFTITNQTGTSIPYIETQTKLTDQFGLFTCVIGQGIQTGGTGTFSQVDWKAYNYYIKVEIQEGTNYYVIGNEPLLTVPYAMVSKESINTVPPGTIIAFAGPNLPAGWLFCDGSQVDKTDYPDLYNAIGTSWGTPSACCFNLPDLRGLFLRGMDNMNNTVGIGGGDANRDPDKTTRDSLSANGNSQGNVGSHQDDAFQGHYHNSGSVYTSSTGSGSFPSGSTYGITNNVVFAPKTDGTNGTPRITSETRPKNVYVNYIIKY